MLSVEKCDQIRLQTIKNLVTHELSKMKERLKQLVNMQIDETSNGFDFQEEIQISNQLNLIEQLDLVENLVDFSALDSSDLDIFSSQLVVFQQDVKEKELKEKRKNAKKAQRREKEKEMLLEKFGKVLNALNGLNKSEIIEIKAFKSPPEAAKNVGEAM